MSYFLIDMKDNLLYIILTFRVAIGKQLDSKLKQLIYRSLCILKS